MPRERKPIAEDLRQIRLQQMPAAGKQARLQWADGAFATLERQGEAVRMVYRWPDGERWRMAVQAFRLMAYRPHLGGVRFFVGCSDCGRRVLKLYDLGGRFACRHCGKLANRSQSQGAWVRALQRAQRIRHRLGAAGGVGDPIPLRPKWMRWRTYQALVAELQALEALPLGAWASDGRRVALGIRQDRMGARQRCRWWLARNHRAEYSMGQDR